MNILHICSNYIGNKLYKELFYRFSTEKEVNFNQHIYIPVRHENLINRNKFKKNNVTFYYDNVLLKRDRILYGSKIKKQLNQIESHIKEIKTIDLIHAHTLYSDGGTAYLLKRKFNLRYIVSVRATDINLFYKYGIHLRGFIKKVLQHAEAIVFISHAYKEKTFEILPLDVVKSIKKKVYVIPNGIDESWFNKEIGNKQEKDNKKKEMLFTGKIDKNKNLRRVLEALKELNRQGDQYFLHIAGEGPLKEELEGYAQKLGLSSEIKFYGHVNKEELIKIMDRVDIFVLPSIHETFGISYIEALSRGIPIIYSKKQGIDGFFEEGQVGYSVDPLNVQDIASKIRLIGNFTDSISTECILQSENFSWSLIGKEYKHLYLKSAEN